MSESLQPQPRFESPSHYVRGRHSGNAQSVTDAGLVVTEVNNGCYLNLRGDASNAEFNAAVLSVLGISLPLMPGTFVANDTEYLYWLGPNEWLLVSAQPGQKREADLRAALKGHIAVVDVSGGFTQLNLCGPSLNLVLKKSSVYDFEEWWIQPKNDQRCVQTTFAKASALVIGQSQGSFAIIIRRSFTDYIAQWLLDCAADNGCFISP
jgi:sarcosine oxidase subunit gamma